MGRRLLVFLLVLVTIVGCERVRKDRIVIGSKSFTEQLIVGELIAQHLESHTRLSVQRRFYLAGTYICHQAILGGRVDIYPEYTGTALTAILKEAPRGDADWVRHRVRTQYAERFGLEVGPPLGFNDTFAILIRGEDARRLELRTLSEAASHARSWRPGFGYEFMERPDGFKGLEAAYGLKFAAPPRTMELGLLTRALHDKQVDLIAGNMTDGLIPALDLAVLEDDLHFFPPYEAVPVVRRETLAMHPELGAALEQLAGRISDADMRSLNYAVDGERRDVHQVVREFLREKGL